MTKPCRQGGRGAAAAWMGAGDKAGTRRSWGSGRIGVTGLSRMRGSSGAENPKTYASATMVLHGWIDTRLNGGACPGAPPAGRRTAAIA